MSPELIQKIIELDQFDCKGHHWFEKIGGYDEKTKTFQKVKIWNQVVILIRTKYYLQVL